MPVVRRCVYHAWDATDGLTWGRWEGSRLTLFSWREGGSKATFTVRLKWGWLPVAFYVAVPIFGRWLRLNRGRLLCL